MPTILKRRSSRSSRSSSRPSANRPPATVPIRALGVGTSGPNLIVTYDQAVVLTGVPRYAIDVAGLTPVAAALTTPTQVTITYSGPVATAGTVTIPYEEPAVRNASGGFVATSTLAVS